MSKLNRTLLVALCALFPLLTHADQGSIANTGSAANPAGTLTVSGTALTYISADGTTAINATFTTSSSVESCSGGGRGGHVTCGITFTGSFTGTLTVNGVTQAISGVTNQYGAVGGASSGTTAYNSAYHTVLLLQQRTDPAFRRHLRHESDFVRFTGERRRAILWCLWHRAGFAGKDLRRGYV
jgi:hypothetical protein